MARTEFNLARSRGDAVISLLERANVAPLPALYGLVYDYVAGAQTLDAIRVGTLIDAPDAAEQVTGERLYEEFVRPYEPGEAAERAIATMVERLVALDALIVEHQEASRTESASLAEANETLAKTQPDAKLMREWVVRLAVASEATRRVHVRLSEELNRATLELASTRNEMVQLGRDALLDPLTGVANRAGLDGLLSSAMTEANASNMELTLAVVDVDHFKRFNDTYGHQVGDDVLRIVGRALLANSRADDGVGRMGGDEFIVIFRDAPRERVLEAAETIRKTVIESDLTQVLGRGVLGNITVSIGVASYRSGDSIASLIERADRCLFEAKRGGRNRVCADETDEPEVLAAEAG